MRKTWSIRPVGGSLNGPVKGRGVRLSSFYKPREVRSGVGFIGEIPPFPIEPAQRGMKNIILLVSGRVQRVAFRAAVTKLFGAVSHAGRINELQNMPDGTVRISLQASQVELDRFLEYVKPGAAYHVVFGDEGDFQSGRCVVVRDAEKVPANAKYVFTPVIERVEMLEDIPL